MPDRLSNKKRTAVKDLPKKGKRLSADDMKRVKGGVGITASDDWETPVDFKAPKPRTTK